MLGLNSSPGLVTDTQLGMPQQLNSHHPILKSIPQAIKFIREVT